MRAYLVIAASVCLGVSPFFAVHRIAPDMVGNPHDRQESSSGAQVDSLRTMIGEAQDLIPPVCPYVS